MIVDCSENVYTKINLKKYISNKYANKMQTFVKLFNSLNNIFSVIFHIAKCTIKRLVQYN